MNFKGGDAVRLLLEYTPLIKPRQDTAKSSSLKSEETRNLQWNIQKSSPQSLFHYKPKHNVILGSFSIPAWWNSSGRLCKNQPGSIIAFVIPQNLPVFVLLHSCQSFNCQSTERHPCSRDTNPTASSLTDRTLSHLGEFECDCGRAGVLFFFSS